MKKIKNEGLMIGHEFMKEFLNTFDKVPRGGVHDLLELSLFNMLANAMDDINLYLTPENNKVNGYEISTIVVNSYQQSLDKMKRNLNMDQNKEVFFKHDAEQRN